MRNDATKLKESLTVEDIKMLLTELGAQHIEDNSSKKDEVITNTICHNVSDGGHKLYYKPSRHSFHCFTQCSCSFDIYELIKKVYNLRGNEISFGNTIEYVATKTGKSTNQNIFGQGFLILDEPKVNTELEWMQRFTRKKKLEVTEPKTHSKKILDVFSNIHHPEFLKDSINVDAMEKFQISYYNKENRIIIPHFAPLTGELIGIRGRALNEWEITSGFKYLPITVQNTMYNFPSYSQLYGFWQNKETIKRLKKAIVFESEKSVLQCESYYPNNNFSVATMGRNISQYQIDLLLGLGIEEIQIATDKMWNEGNDIQKQRDIEFLENMGRKFSPYVRTFALFDKKNRIEYKSSPSDHGKEILETLMREKVEILNRE